MSDSIFKYQLPAELSDRLSAVIAEPTYTAYSGTPGDCVANTRCGHAAFDAGTAITVITNSLVGPLSIVHAQLEVLDSVAVSMKVVCTANTITCTAKGNANADALFSWYVVKA